MDPHAFAEQLDALYRALYHRAARRLADGRERLSPETTTLLNHLAQAGPSTLSELAAHFDRALSTLSVKLAALEQQGLVARQPFAGDGRRSLLWLSPAGRSTLAEALEVLDTGQLAAAAAQWSAAEAEQFLALFSRLVAALPPPATSIAPHAGEPDHVPRL